jgi:hypothetical protein
MPSLKRIVTASVIFLAGAAAVVFFDNNGHNERITRWLIIAAMALAVWRFIPGGLFDWFYDPIFRRVRDATPAMPPPPVVAPAPPSRPAPRVFATQQPLPAVRWQSATDPHGALDVVDGKLRYGWFEFSEQPRAITNYLTGQRLAIISSKTFDTTAVHRCSVHDPGLALPITFTLQLAWNGHQFQLWMDYNEMFSGAPAYALWRRIDDFLADALACWPDYILSDGGLSLVMCGGWRGSRWQQELQRKFSSGKVAEFAIRDRAPKKLSESYTLATPFLMPLEAPTPPGWRYVDQPTTEPKIALPFQYIEGLNIPFIDAAAPLQMFKGRTPYLEREDGAAWIFPSHLEPDSHRGESPLTNLWYTYLDPQLFLSFRSHETYRGLELAYVLDYGFRRFPPPEQLWTAEIFGKAIPATTPRLPPEDYRHHGSYLGYSVWRELAASLGDAWPSWPTPGRLIEIDPTTKLPEHMGRSARVGDHGQDIVNGYSAGMRNHNYRMTFMQR